MIITIRNFKNIESRVIEFDETGTTLLKGANGKGKTSTFEAIEWCLYRSRTKVKPFDAKSSTRTTVRINVRVMNVDYVITRTNNPCLFEVVRGEIKLLDQLAEEHIIQLFGSHDLWRCSSYIEQQSSGNHLLYADAATKFKIIAEIAQLNESDHVISSLSSRISASASASSNLTTLLAGYEQLTRSRIDGSILTKQFQVCCSHYFPQSPPQTPRDLFQRLTNTILVDPSQEHRQLKQRLATLQSAQSLHAINAAAIIETRDAIDKLPTSHSHLTTQQLQEYVTKGRWWRDRLQELSKIISELHHVRLSAESIAEISLIQEGARRLINTSTHFELITRLDHQCSNNLSVLGDKPAHEVRHFDIDNLKRDLPRIPQIRSLQSQLNQIPTYEGDYDRALLKAIRGLGEVDVDGIAEMRTYQNVHDQTVMRAISRLSEADIASLPQLNRDIDDRQYALLQRFDVNVRQYSALYEYIELCDHRLAVAEVCVQLYECSQRVDLQAALQSQDYDKYVGECPSCHVHIAEHNDKLIQVQQLHHIDKHVDRSRIRQLRDMIASSGTTLTIDCMVSLGKHFSGVNLSSALFSLELRQHLDSIKEINTFPSSTTSAYDRLLKLQRRTGLELLQLRSISPQSVSDTRRYEELRRRYSAYDDIDVNRLRQIIDDDLRRKQITSQLGKYDADIVNFYQSLTPTNADIESIVIHTAALYRDKEVIVIRKHNICCTNRIAFVSQSKPLEACDDEMRAEIEDLKSKLNAFETLSDEMSATILSRRHRREQLKQKLAALQEIESRDVSEEIAITTKLLSTKSLEMRVYDFVMDMSSNMELIDTKQKELERTNSMLRNLQMLLSVSKDVRTEMLEDRIASINNLATEMCQAMFSENVSFAIAYERQLVNGNRKNEVNFRICIKDHERDSIKACSGGEAERISLALTLSLAFMSRFPIVILDESMSYIDTHAKESCVDSIMSLARTKGIVVVSHDVVEGDFDHILTL